MATKSEEGVAQVYAHALYGAAKAAGVLDVVEQEVRAIQDLLLVDPRFRLFLETPAVTVDQKREVFRAILQGFSEITFNFLSILISKRRALALGSIIEVFHAYLNEQAGIAEVEVRTARKLDPEETQRLKDVLKNRLNKIVAIREYVRPELLGGLVVTLGDLQWNGSLSHHLGQLARRMDALKGSHGAWKEAGHTN